MPETARARQITVSSEISADGYILTVNPTDDVTLPLGRDAAVRYGLAVLAAAQYADYEAAVWAQMHAAGLGPEVAGAALTVPREQRRPLDREATAPLTFDPILSASTHRGMVRLLLRGTQIEQLEPAAAAKHANDVLAMCAVAELDGLYYRWLRDGIVREPTARHIVADLADHHPDGWLGRR